jgi:hypothetical protein
MPSAQIKDEKTYRELRGHGESKEKGARIANAAAATSRSQVGRKGGKVDVPKQPEFAACRAAAPVLSRIAAISGRAAPRPSGACGPPPPIDGAWGPQPPPCNPVPAAAPAWTYQANHRNQGRCRLAGSRPQPQAAY